MKAVEPGQDWKIAALRSNFHVHFLFGGNMNLKFLDEAFKYAQIAFDNNEVPIGCVIVKDGEIVSYAYNTKESDNNITSHAEIKAIIDAENKVNNWRLSDCDLYVTLDPCPMCASAIKQSRIKNVYSALNNLDSNNLNIISEIFKSDMTNGKVSFVSNLNPDKSLNLLNSFFKKQRNK